MNDKFKEVGSFSVNNKKPQCALMIIFLMITGLGIVFLFLTKVYTNNNTPIWVIICCVVGFIIIHELIHIIFMSVISKGKIKISIIFPTIAVGSDAYFNKFQYILIALAPVIILGLISLICLLLSVYKFLFTILLILNFATAAGDYILTYYAFKQKNNTYFVDNVKVTKVYKKCS